MGHVSADRDNGGVEMLATLTKMMLAGAVVGLLLLALVAVVTPRLQRRLIYYPDASRVLPDGVGLVGVSEVRIEAPDGAVVLAWYAPAAPGQPTILYFHGNAGALVTRAERFRKYRALGRGMLMMTYRGFGGSTGVPSESANVSDAMRALDMLRDRGVSAADIVLYGESLGSGVAVQVAAAREVGGVVLDAPYTSMVDMAELVYPLLPARFVMTDRYETLRHVARVRAPVLIVHGEADEVIPVAMGRRVKQAAGGPAEIVTFPGAGHSNHHQFGSFEVVNRWIDQLRSANGRPLGGSEGRAREAGAGRH